VTLLDKCPCVYFFNDIPATAGLLLRMEAYYYFLKVVPSHAMKAYGGVEV
jgi:hypothetical protein